MSDREQRLEYLLMQAKCFIETMLEKLGSMQTVEKLKADIEKELEAK